MPINKNALIRFRLIDSLLRKHKYVKTKLIIEKLLEYHDLEVGDTTINKDIRDMQTDLKAPIDYDSKNKAYYYPENVEEIFPGIELKLDEINALLFYAKTINQYKDYPIFVQISNAIKKVIDSSNISEKTKELFTQKTLLETEKHPPITGIEYITDLLDAISNKQIIEIEYQKFKGSPKTYKLKPLLLKEDRLLWYILGYNTDNNRIVTFALDRINYVNVTADNFDDPSFESEEYFKHSFGITVQEGPPKEIVVSFDVKQSDYLKALPIHATQEIVIDTESEFMIKLTVKPSYEFYSKILSYGDAATILSPQDIKIEFLNIFSRAVNNYKSAK